MNPQSDADASQLLNFNFYYAKAGRADVKVEVDCR
jgi:hypothetical protein